LNRPAFDLGGCSGGCCFFRLTSLCPGTQTATQAARTAASGVGWREKRLAHGPVMQERGIQVAAENSWADAKGRIPSGS
jgi:hypothetical protein